MAGDPHAHPHMAQPKTDPVCGMTPKPDTPHRLTDETGEVLFCSAGCKAKYEAAPEKYRSGATPSANTQAAAPGLKWTCPMHPEIVRDRPGPCPICGMALEPMTPAAEDAPNPELADMTLRFWVGLALSAPVFVLEMGRHFLGIDRVVPPHVNVWIQLVLATPVVMWAGFPFLVRGAASLRSRNLNMFTLIALGTGVAWSYSVVATLAPSIFPPGLHDAHGLVPVYFEASAVITVLVLLGQVLELRARARTGGAIRALLDLAPKTARRVLGESEDEIPIDQIAIGDHLRVRPGEKRLLMASSSTAGPRWMNPW